MSKMRCFILILGVLLFILHCTEKSTQPEIKPDRVQLIQGGSPYDEVERGIDAVPEVDAIYVEWFDPDDPSIEFYEIYRGEDPADRFIPVGKVFDPDTSFSDEEVELYTRYYYYVLAVSDLGARSESSDTLYYKLLEKTGNLRPAGVWSETKPKFSWDDVQAHLYLARIVDVTLDEVVWMAEAESQYSERVEIAFDSTMASSVDSLDRHKDYLWRVDVVGEEVNSGSESQWIPLRIE